MDVIEDGDRALLQLSRGEELITAVEAWAQGTLLIEGGGALAEIEIEDADGERRKIGSAEALSLRGAVVEGDAILHATLLRGAQVLGGRLRSATVVFCALRAERFSGRAERSLAPASVPPRPPSVPVSAAAGGWAAAAEASTRAAAPKPRPSRPRPSESSVPLHRPKPIPTSRDRASSPSFLDEPQIEVADYVDHRQFGLCRVERVQDNGGLLLKLPTGRRKLIKLEVFVVEEPIEDPKGRRVFALAPRRRER